MKKILIILTLSTLIFSYNLNYKIKYFGIHVADCKISKIDTVYKAYPSTKIVYKVNTKPFFKNLFPVNNTYKIIVNNKKEILFFSKNTTQPNVENFIETELRNNQIFYKNTDIKIARDSYNIFSLLYSIMEGEVPPNFILEKEGLLFNGNIELLGENIYDLKISNILDSNIQSVVHKTDIFTWGIFMDNAKRRLFVNQKNGLIEQCIFTKGIITIKAELY